MSDENTGDWMVFDPVNDIEFFEDVVPAMDYAERLAAELVDGPQPEAAEAVLVCRVVRRFDRDINAKAN
jgi:hypothetical protein